MSELRAGGIAIVIFSENKPEIGRCVELIEKVTNGYVFNFPGAGKHSWRDDTPGWLVISALVSRAQGEASACV